MRYSGVFTLGWLVCLLGLIGLSGANLILGNLNQDEGWYAYAALQVAQGQFPFLDFAYTQGPVLPFVYALFAACIREGGLLTARVLTLILGLGGHVLFTLIAVRLAPRFQKGWVALAVFSLLTLNSYQSYFTTILKTYSLTLLLLGLMTWFLLSAVEKESRNHAIVAALFGALAVGTRLSAIAAMGAAALLLVVQYRKLSHPCVVGFWLAGMIAGVLIFVPFLILAPENTWFGMVSYHSAREVGSAGSLVVYKLGFLSRLMQAYSVWFMLFIIVLGLRCFRETPSIALPVETIFLERFLWTAGLGMTALHVIASFPYDDYQVPVYPLLVLAAVLPLFRRLPAAEEMRRASAMAATLILLACGMAAVASPMNQDWMIQGRDRIWWKLKSSPDLIKLQQVADFLQEQGATSPLLTQDTYLAVEAGLDVPEGLEMGPFALYADWEDSIADTYHVMNLNGLKKLIESGTCSHAAISGYGLSIRSPEVTELTQEERGELHDLLNTHYRKIRTYPNFGQGHTDLNIYELRSRGDGEKP